MVVKFSRLHLPPAQTENGWLETEQQQPKAGSFLLLLFCFVLFAMGSHIIALTRNHYGAQINFELRAILLSKCQDNRCTEPWPASFFSEEAAAYTGIQERNCTTTAPYQYATLHDSHLSTGGSGHNAKICPWGAYRHGLACPPLKWQRWHKNWHWVLWSTVRALLTNANHMYTWACSFLSTQSIKDPSRGRKIKWLHL